MEDPGYEFVIETVRRLHRERTGSEWGASAWFADELGVSRQSLNGWRNVGFPKAYVDKIKAITGLSENQICPIATVPVAFPAELWDEVVSTSRGLRRSPSETVVELVRIGLKSRSKS